MNDINYIPNCFPVTIQQENFNVVPKVAMIVLDTDLTCEHDFHHLRNKFSTEFDVYVNRIPFANPVSIENLSNLLEDLPKVVSGILPEINLDAIVFNCTAASALLGDDAVIKAIGRTDIPVITTATAALSQIKKSNLTNVDLLCPYSKEVSLMLADYFAKNGLDIKSLTYMNVADDRDIARISQSDIIATVKKTITDSSNSLFLSCTALRVATIVDELESIIHKKVFSSNYSSFCQIISELNIDQKK